MAKSAPRVWITRTQPGADATAERVRALGWTPVVTPLLEVRAIPDAMKAAPAAASIDALALTSPNTLAVLGSALATYRDVPAFAVGDTTAQAATAAGLTKVTSASGDIHALAALIADLIPSGTIFAPGAKEPAGDLPALLPSHSVIRLPVYETTQTDAASPVSIDTILVHSPRAARILASNTRGLGNTGTHIVAISEAAAAPLKACDFGKIVVSPTPDEEGVLTTLGNAPTPV